MDALGGAVALIGVLFRPKPVRPHAEIAHHPHLVLVRKRGDLPEKIVLQSGLGRGRAAATIPGVPVATDAERVNHVHAEILVPLKMDRGVGVRKHPGRRKLMRRSPIEIDAECLDPLRLGIARSRRLGPCHGREQKSRQTERNSNLETSSGRHDDRLLGKRHSFVILTRARSARHTGQRSGARGRRRRGHRGQSTEHGVRSMEHTVRTRKYGLRRATIKNKLRHGRRLDPALRTPYFAKPGRSHAPTPDPCPSPRSPRLPLSSPD